jgi:pilus assembly protein Flp/PilA
MIVREVEKGQGFVEYAMLLILVAIFVLVLVYIFGKGVGALFSNVVQII